MLLAGKEKTAKIFVSCKEAGVIRAAEDLCRDIGRVTGREAVLSEERAAADIVIGPGGAVAEPLLEGRRECFVVREQDGQLIISGADKRGTIYGIYHISETIGVSPWYWWADVPEKRQEELHVDFAEPYFSGEPSVKYRGIFINDEESMAAWAMHRGDYDYLETYERIYELLLRLRGNILWPAMHECSPHFHKNHRNAENADLYGIVIGTSHCEQMLRNNVMEYFPFEEKWVKAHPEKKLYRKILGDSSRPCAYVYTDIDPDTGVKVYNKEMIRDYWKECLEQFGGYENMYTIGMRGLHDFPWQPVGADTPEEKARLIEEVISDQRELIREYTGKDPSEIPQLFVPYKEMLEVYNAGMKVPEDVTLMWTDDNYGYLRQLPNQEERARKGGIGMYYHACYCGSPRSYLWMSTTPFALIKEEMTKAYDNGVQNTWILNAGDLKGAERQIEYFLDLAWDIGQKDGLPQYVASRAMRDFGLPEEEAEEFARIELEFQRLAFSRKPEFFEENLFALQEFNDEGDRYLQEYERLVRRSGKLMEKLPEERKPAYFELHYYFLHACRSVARQYILMDEQRRHLSDGYKNAAEHFIYESDAGYYDMIEDMRVYYRLFDGKWNHIMDACHGWFIERGNGTSYSPLLACKKEWSREPGIGVAGEGMRFSGYTKEKRFLDIFRHCGGAYTKWWIETAEDWILPDRRSGRVVTDERVWIDIDYDKAPKDNVHTLLTVCSEEGDAVLVEIFVENRIQELPEKTFAESCGYVSMFACNYTRMRETEHSVWRTEPYLGREKDCLKLYGGQPGEAAAAEYDILFVSSGTFSVNIYRLPTLNERGKVRFGIALDDDRMETVEGTNQYVDFASPEDAWGQGVLRNSEMLTASVTVMDPGIHTLKLFGIDPDVMIEKLVIWTEKEKESYFGPTESGAGFTGKSV